jgi:MFS family permease
MTDITKTESSSTSAAGAASRAPAGSPGGAGMERKWWTLLAVCVGTFMLLLDVTIVVVAIPDIQRGLHASFGQIQWVIDAYALTLASLLLTGGVLADRYGRRLLFAIGLIIFTLGSLLCGLALGH